MFSDISGVTSLSRVLRYRSKLFSTSRFPGGDGFQPYILYSRQLDQTQKIRSDNASMPPESDNGPLGSCSSQKKSWRCSVGIAHSHCYQLLQSRITQLPTVFPLNDSPSNYTSPGAVSCIVYIDYDYIDSEAFWSIFQLWYLSASKYSSIMSRGLWLSWISKWGVLNVKELHFDKETTQCSQTFMEWHEAWAHITVE